MDDRPLVVNPRDVVPAAAAGATSAMERRPLLEREDCWVGWVRADAGVAGGWHHHGDRDSYIYVLRGQVRIDFGPGGRESVSAGAGEFIFNPRRMVHREVTAPGEDSEFFVVRVGSGPQNVNVDGPDPDGGGPAARPEASGG